MTTPNIINVRGKTKGVNLDRFIEANGGKPFTITLKASNGKQTENVTTRNNLFCPGLSSNYFRINYN